MAGKKQTAKTKVLTLLGLYFLVAFGTFGWTYHRQCAPENAYDDPVPCAILRGGYWPIYWPAQAAISVFAP